MKIENHLESFKEHKETIFEWALKIKGLKDSQRVIFASSLFIKEKLD